MTRTPDKTLAEAAKRLRIRKGYSQAEIAHRYGVAQPFISRMEGGASGDVRAYFEFLTFLNPSDERAAGNIRAAKRKASMNIRTTFEVIEDPKEIAKARKTLIRFIREAASEKAPLSLGHKGDTFTAGDAYYFGGELDLWTVFDDGSGHTYWNTYGLGNPFTGGNRNMVCHLTVPTDGINRRTGAVYARSTNGDTYIMHRGRIGGGREGLGKTTFWKYVNQHGTIKTAFVQDGNRVSEMVIVTRLVTSKSMLRNIRDFVMHVHSIKSTV